MRDYANNTIRNSKIQLETKLFEHSVRSCTKTKTKSGWKAAPGKSRFDLWIMSLNYKSKRRREGGRFGIFDQFFFSKTNYFRANNNLSYQLESANLFIVSIICLCVRWSLSWFRICDTIKKDDKLLQNWKLDFILLEKLFDAIKKNTLVSRNFLYVQMCFYF